MWKGYKLTFDKYDDYLFKSRDGVLYRKRNLEACRTRAEEEAERFEMEAVIKRIRTNPAKFQPFPSVPRAAAWLKVFEEDELRYPILLVLGRSHTGKTEWAKSLFTNPLEVKIGDNQQFPEAMRSFKRGVHDGIVLDDVRDLQFLVLHQEKLQAKYDSRIEFASTPGGQCAYTRWLFAVPIVVTCNYTTDHLDHLETDDFLGNPKNRVLIYYPPTAGA